MSTDDTPSCFDGRTVIRQKASTLPQGSGPTIIAGKPYVADQATPVAAFPGDNPILCAAAPLLSLLAAPNGASKPFDKACADAIHQAGRDMEQAGVAAAERTAALLVLCETADDIGPVISGIGRAAWQRQSMMQGFFLKPPSPTAFFEMLNRLFRDPAGHYPLLQLMHACLALGFQGQYRGQPRQATGLKQTCDDLHATLRHLRPHPARTGRPRQPEPSAVVRKSWPLWVMAAVVVVIMAAGSAFMHQLISRDGDAVAAALTAFSPPGVVTVERALRETPR